MNQTGSVDNDSPPLDSRDDRDSTFGIVTLMSDPASDWISILETIGLLESIYRSRGCHPEIRSQIRAALLRLTFFLSRQHIPESTRYELITLNRELRLPRYE